MEINRNRRINLDEISKKNISSINFESTDIIEINSKDDYKGRPIGIEKIPSDNEKNIKLRKIMSNIFYTNVQGSYDKLNVLTQISESTFRKILSGSRNITRTIIAKFVVGLQIDIETANELFTLLGNPLNMNNRLDYIIACAIKDKDDIEIFNEDLVKYDYPALYKDE